MDLVNALDTYVPEPTRDLDKPFLAGGGRRVLHHRARAQSATGRIERGKVHTNDEVEIIGLHPDSRKTVVTGVEMFRKTLDEGMPADNIGCFCAALSAPALSAARSYASRAASTAHEVRRHQSLHYEEGRGRPPQAVLHRIPPQFYNAHHPT